MYNCRQILNNAKVGAAIASEYAALRRAAEPASTPAGPRVVVSAVVSPSKPSAPKPATSATVTAGPPRKLGAVLVFGGATMDIAARAGEPVHPRTTTPGTVTQHPGGVGRNVAEAAYRLGAAATLYSVRGDGDAVGDAMAAALATMGLPSDLTPVAGARTACYTALIGTDGDMAAAIGDMAVFTRGLTPAWVDAHAAAIAAAGIVCADGNLPPPALARLAAHCARHDVPRAWLGVVVLLETVRGAGACPRLYRMVGFVGAGG